MKIIIEGDDDEELVLTDDDLDGDNFVEIKADGCYPLIELHAAIIAFDRKRNKILLEDKVNYEID